MKSRTSGQHVKGVKKSGCKASVPAGTAGQPLLPKPSAKFVQDRCKRKVRDLQLARGPAVTRETNDLAAIHTDAAARSADFQREGCPEVQQDFGQSLTAANRHREAENTRKKFYTELRKVLAAADVVIEVLDARDPASCRNQELERQVLAGGKRLVLLINKIDLVPKHAIEAWLASLRRSFPAVAFKAAHGGSTRSTYAMTTLDRASDGLLQSTHAVVGADELMQLLKNYARTGVGKAKAHVNVGVVGYPNTGKSSVINSMKRHAAVEVGGRAGVTKVLQEVQLDSKVTLIDSPGVVFEGSSQDHDLVLRNVVRVENVADPVGAVEALAGKAPRQSLLSFYGMPRDFVQIGDFLAHVARARGKLRRGKGLDLASAAKSVISDWTTGRFQYFVLPPQAAEAASAAAVAEDATVVTHLAPELNVDALFDGNCQAPAVLGAPDSDVDM